MTRSVTNVFRPRTAGAMWTAAGAFLLALVIPAGSDLAQWSYGIQASLLFAGLAAVIIGLGDENGSRMITAGTVSRQEILAVCGITLAALAARLAGLETSIRFLIDEGNSIRHMQVAAGGDVGLLDPPSVYVTTMLYPYGNALAAAAIGPSLTGLRFLSALLGAATIPAVYVLARSLFDRSTALSAAALLASFPPHLHFSRLALPHVMDALFGTIAMAAIAGGLTSNRRRQWAIAGAALGLTHYGFEAGRWFFTPLVILWLGYLACFGATSLRSRRRGIAVLATAFAAAALPVYVAALLRGSPLSPRLRTSIAALGEAGLAEIVQRGAAAFAPYVSQPDTSLFYFGDSALILTPLLPLFAIGNAVSLYPPARLRSLTTAVPLWLAAAAVGNAAMRDSASYARWVVAYPAIAVALAVGLCACTRRLPRARPATVAATLVVATLQLAYYFGPHLQRVNEQWRAAKADRDVFDGVLMAVEQLPAETDLYFVSNPIIDLHPPRELLSFIAAEASMGLDGLTPAELRDAIAALPSKRGAAFFVGEDDTTSAQLLAALPRVRGPLRSNHPIPPGERFELYFVPP